MDQTQHSTVEMSRTCRHAGQHLRRGSITIWNVVALLVIILGGLATLAAGQLYLHAWADSGIHVPVGGRYKVELPYGTSLVYYESSQEVPQRIPLLKVLDAYGAYAKVQPIRDLESNNFRMMLTGWSGRATHTIEIDEEGTFTVSCSPADYFSNEDVPADDRVALFKEPNALEEAHATYKLILIVGATITAVLAFACYGMHFTAIRRKAAHDHDA